MSLRTFIHRVLDAQREKDTKEPGPAQAQTPPPVSSDPPTSVNQTSLAEPGSRVCSFSAINKLTDENIYIGG